MRYRLCIPGFALLLFSCARPKDLVYRDVRNFSVKQAGLKQTTLAMDVRLYNPNKYSIKLKKADVDVYMDATRLGKLRLDKKAVIAAGDTSSMPVRLDVDLGNVLPNMMQFLSAKEFTIRLNGSIRAGRRLVFVKVPVLYEGKQEIAPLLQSGILGGFR